jgi:2-methylcitrate dehydratase PrpD
MLIHQNPQDHLEGKFSAQYAVATALVYRKASMEQFTDTAVQNSDVQTIMKKVSVVADPKMEKTIHSAVVMIKLLDGKQYTNRVDVTTGHPQKPMSLDRIIDKYKDCAASIIDGDDIERSVNEVLNFEQIENVDRLVASIGKSSIETFHNLLTDNA